MLKRWSIENFKSFRDRTDIPLASITVFAGANSSGKSTILQSILLLKQTVQFAEPTHPIALNGPLVKLGAFDDVKNAVGSASYIGIGWELEAEEPSQQQVRSFSLGALRTWSILPYFGNPTFRSIDLPLNAPRFVVTVPPPLTPQQDVNPPIAVAHARLADLSDAQFEASLSGATRVVVIGGCIE